MRGNVSTETMKRVRLKLKWTILLARVYNVISLLSSFALFLTISLLSLRLCHELRSTLYKKLPFEKLNLLKRFVQCAIFALLRRNRKTFIRSSATLSISWQMLCESVVIKNSRQNNGQLNS